MIISLQNLLIIGWNLYIWLELGYHYLGLLSITTSSIAIEDKYVCKTENSTKVFTEKLNFKVDIILYFFRREQHL